MNNAEIQTALNEQNHRLRQLEEQVEQLFALSNRHVEATNRALRHILGIVRDIPEQ